MRALARGDVAGAIAHEKNAEAFAHAEHHPHWKGKGKGKGKGYAAAEVVVVSAAPAPTPAEVVVVAAAPAPPPEVVVVSAAPAPVVIEAVAVPGHKGCGKGKKAAERALHCAEKQEEVAASAFLARGDVVDAVVDAERASALKRAEHEVHHDVLRSEAHRAHHQEKRQEHMAAQDLAHGHLLGAIAHEVRAGQDHDRERKVEAELHHHRLW
jgi:hypothetical protein